MNQRFRILGITADADGNFPHTELIQHVELTREQRETAFLPSSGRRSTVKVSLKFFTVRSIRNGTGIIGSSFVGHDRNLVSFFGVTVEIDQLPACRRQTRSDNRREALVKFIAKSRILLHLSTQARRVDADESGQF